MFIAPLQLLAKDETRLHYLASFAKEGALRAMGTFAAEKCASSCLPLLVTPSSDTEAEWACTLLKELIKCLTPSAVETLILPAIQKILQVILIQFKFSYIFFLSFFLFPPFLAKIFDNKSRQQDIPT